MSAQIRLATPIGQVWPAAITQTCIVHPLRNSFRYASRRDWEAVARALRPVYTTPSEAAALDAFAEFSGHWEAKYPAIVKLWESAWGRVRALPGLRQGDPHADLHHQRDRGAAVGFWVVEVRLPGSPRSGRPA